MNIVISDKIYIENPSYEVRKWAYDNLNVVNPTYNTLKRLGKDDTIRYKHIPERMDLYSIRGNTYILPFGVLNAIWPMIKDSEYKTSFNDNGNINCKDDIITQPLFDYQEEAVQAMVKAKSGILQGGCGSGKTNVGIEIAHRLGKKFLWLTHTHDLLNQTKKRIEFLYPNMKIGTITGGKINIGEDCTLATVQTMANIDKEIYKNEFDVVIVDEAHHVSGSPTLMKYFSKVINNIPARYKYGLTATPNRGDTLTKSIYTYISCNTNGEFAPSFIISRDKLKVLTATHNRIETGIKMDYNYLNTDGTFDYNKLIDYLSNSQERNDLILRKIKELILGNRKQLVLCSRVDHCKELYYKLCNEGIKAEMLVGEVSAKKREKVLTDTTNSWDVIVATYALAKEGLDVPQLDTLHLTTPQKDKATIIQCAGRVERYIENKNEPIILDYVDDIPYCLGAFTKRKNILKRRQ